MRKPSCIERECMHYSPSEEMCSLENDEAVAQCCPCENGEWEAVYGEMCD